MSIVFASVKMRPNSMSGATVASADQVARVSLHECHILANEAIRAPDFALARSRSISAAGLADGAITIRVLNMFPRLPARPFALANVVAMLGTLECSRVCIDGFAAY